MDRKLFQLGFCLVAFAASAAAQTVTGSGTTNTVPVFTGTSTVGNSPISVSGSNVGIGTTSPADPLAILANQSRSLYMGTGAGTLQIDGANAGNGVTSITLGKFTLTGGPDGIIGLDRENSGSTMFFGTSNLYSSGITNTALAIAPSGKVGVGTASPGFELDVQGGQINSSGGYCINGSSNCITAWPTSGGSGTVTGISTGGGLSGGPITNSGTISLNLGSSNAWTGAQTFGAGASFPGGIWNTAGSVGIGITPQDSLDILPSGGKTVGIGGGSNTGSEIKFTYSGVAHFSIYNSGNNNLTIANTSSSGLTNALGTALISVASSGNVGIGTTNPGYKLDVAGQIHTSGGIVFPDGSTQSAAYTGINCGGDYAESVEVTGDRKKFQPGDILVIDPDHPGKFLKSAEPYSTSVTGIYSTKPGTVGRRQTMPKSPDEVPMAMLGIVPTKVSAENGPIKPGDLLVTSSKIGYAMKGTDRSRMLGAVVGKALGSLDSGTGVIEVVVTLQ
jgi:hypothetical protein